jgi:tRNA(Ile)-lysidine synthase
VRYHALEAAAAAHRLELILLGHHHDDQLETVILRWIAGSTLVGLAGMEPLRGLFGRPFLTLPRARLAQSLQGAGVVPLDDPTNHDLRVPRNRIRKDLLPTLDTNDQLLLARVAGRAATLRRRLEPTLAAQLDLRPEPDGASVGLAAFAALPRPFWPFALHLLSARAGRHVAPRSPVQADLARRLATPSARLRIDAGDGWRLERHGQRLCLLAQGREPRPFAYTLEVPGEREIPEIEASVGIRPAPPDVFPTDAAGRYRGITLPAGAAHRLVVRSRRPGDRFRPLGSSRSHPLQRLLIDWRVRRDLRDRLPLLEIDGEIAWIGGFAVAESFRPDLGSPWWLIELLPGIQVASEVSLGRKAFS